MSGGPSREERAAATIRLLWRDRGAVSGASSRRGRLSVDALVDTAVAVADAEGLEAVTMRRLAQALGVAPMTPYRHVPGKAELLELMVDAVHAGMAVSTSDDDGWRARVTAVAADRRALLRAHPWLLDVPRVRPVLGPGVIGAYDRELAAFEALGLDDVEWDAALASVHGLVEATVRAELEADAVARDSRADDARWWAVVGPLLSAVLDPSAYPLAARVGTAAGEAHGAASDPDVVHAFGLARFLDGLAVLVDARGAGGS